MKDKEKKIIIGRDNICKTYEFGKDTFYWLIAKGAPIMRMKKKYYIHVDTFEEFIKSMTIISSNSKSAN